MVLVAALGLEGWGENLVEGGLQVDQRARVAFRGAAFRVQPVKGEAVIAEGFLGEDHAQHLAVDLQHAASLGGEILGRILALVLLVQVDAPAGQVLAVEQVGLGWGVIGPRCGDG